MTDPYVGQLAFIRVYSGVWARVNRLQRRQAAQERVGRLVKMHANKREEIPEMLAGDICAARRAEERIHRRHHLRRKAPILLENRSNSRRR